MKKQSCRMTQQEKETHKEAGKYRRMTDQQLVDMVNGLKRQVEKAVAERNAEAALAEEKKHEAEIANRAAQDMAEKVKEADGKASGARNAAGKEAVEKFLQQLQIKAGTGNGIGNGTILKLRRILKDMPDFIFAGD